MSTTDEIPSFKEFLKERYPKGKTKLHSNTVRAVMLRLAKGEPVKSIALDMGIGLSAVYNIKNRVTYRRLYE